MCFIVHGIDLFGHEPLKYSHGTITDGLLLNQYSKFRVHNYYR